LTAKARSGRSPDPLTARTLVLGAAERTSAAGEDLAREKAGLRDKLSTARFAPALLVLSNAADVVLYQIRSSKLAVWRSFLAPKCNGVIVSSRSQAGRRGFQPRRALHHALEIALTELPCRSRQPCLAGAVAASTLRTSHRKLRGRLISSGSSTRALLKEPQ
jgi:hypothetical protein